MKKLKKLYIWIIATVIFIAFMLFTDHMLDYYAYMMSKKTINIINDVAFLIGSLISTIIINYAPTWFESIKKKIMIILKSRAKNRQIP